MIEEIVADVIKEMERGSAKFGDQLDFDLFKWAAIVGEEKGEVDKALLEEEYVEGVSLNDVYMECTHVAATAIRMAAAVKHQRHQRWVESGMHLSPEGSFDADY